MDFKGHTTTPLAFVRIDTSSCEAKSSKRSVRYNIYNRLMNQRKTE